MSVKILQVLEQRRYLGISIISTFAFTIFYIYTQVLGNIENIDVWITNAPSLNLILFSIFAILFGITLSFQIYNWKQPKVCALDKKSVGTSSAGTIIGLFVAQCPACASLGALFLPFSVTTFITKYNIFLNLLSICLLLFTLNYLGGFKSTRKRSF